MDATPLDTLEARGLIRLATIQPELEYLFRHWLVQEAAYGSLLKQERRQLHRLVGDALEELYPDRRDELAAVLALHYEQAGENERAVEYLVIAGGQALARNALTEAYSAYDRALTLLPAPTETDPPDLLRRRLEVGLGRAHAGYSMLPITALVDALASLVPGAEQLGDPRLLARLHVDLALARSHAGESVQTPAVQHSLARAEELGGELGDPSLRAIPLAIIGIQQVFNGPVLDGVAALEEAVPLLELGPDSVTTAFARGTLAIGLARLGRFAEADRAARYAVELAERGDLIAQLDAQIAASVVASERGDLAGAVPIAEACVLRAEETGATACAVVSTWILGDVYQRMDRLVDASRTLGRGTELANVVDRMVWRPTLQAWLSSTAAALGEPAEPDAWEEILATARSIGNRFGEAGILHMRGAAAMRDGDTTAAIDDLAAAAAIREELGTRPSLARVLVPLGLALRSAGREAEAETHLRRAAQLFTELGISAEADLALAHVGKAAGRS